MAIISNKKALSRQANVGLKAFVILVENKKNPSNHTNQKNHSSDNH
jgi:hypothetical protein